MKSLRVSIKMKATEQYFPVVLFIYAVQGGSNFPIQMKAFGYYLLVVLFAVLYKGFIKSLVAKRQIFLFWGGGDRGTAGG